MNARLPLRFLLLLGLSLTPHYARCQDPFLPLQEAAPQAPPAPVEVGKTIRDDAIEARLTKILSATEWFSHAEVESREGVAILRGATHDDSHKAWAEALAQRTEGVVAVINHITVPDADYWDLGPAKREVVSLAESTTRALPWILIGGVILAISWILATIGHRHARTLFSRRTSSGLLAEVGARIVFIIVVLLGAYLVLRIAGLTRLATTLLGGTGLLGLIIGIAFREITENFLASIFLSIQRPFRSGDLVEIDGKLGYVQMLTTRSTVLMSTTGNHLQIPNATVFKGVIRNFTTNPNRREDFTIGIGYSDSIEKAQEVALSVMAEHPAVLRSPEPWVLVDSLGAATVNLKVYFWLDGSRHSWLKVKSSVIRLIKGAFEEHGISMPDEARELLFPEGVAVRLVQEEMVPTKPLRRQIQKETSVAEGGLETEAGEIHEQASKARLPEEGSNVLMSGEGNSVR